MVFQNLQKEGSSHEQVIFCSHPETGLKAIVAIHSARLGPALGGCRMYPYATEEEALKDVLQLSSAMSWKAAIAGLKLGGGKSVIIGDPEKHKTPELLWSFGTHIDSLNGRYIVAKDVGISAEDLQYIGDQSSYVLGRPVQRGGVGDPSRSTAQGVLYGIKEAVQKKLKKDSLKGVRVAVQGLGAVGFRLVELLSEEQAEVFVFDIKQEIVQKTLARFPKTRAIKEEEALSLPCDVFAPCAMGGVINPHTIQKLNCSIIAGGANNQLSDVSMGKQLFDKGILYIPDFVINSGGLIYISSYLTPRKSNEWIENKIKEIPRSIAAVCDFSSSEGVDTAQMAISIAKEKIKRAEMGRMELTKF